MKQVYLFVLFFSVISCSTDIVDKTLEIESEVTWETDSTTSNLPPLGFVGFNTGVNILFTDSNNVSVFKSNGYKWVANNIKNYQVVDLAYKDSANLSTELPEYVLQNEDYPNWVIVFLGFLRGEKYQTSILKFPDNTVDTIYWELGEYGDKGCNGVYIKKLWYNDILKLDTENWDLNPEIFPDGRKREEMGRAFQIIK